MMATCASYSLAAAQIHNNFGYMSILLEETENYLLDGVHSQPVTPVDEWISPHVLVYKGLVEVWFIWEVQLGHALF